MSSRHAEAVRRRWEQLDWSTSIHERALVIPERHYMDLGGVGLTGDQRLGLNRLMACFTCELFIHFEAYVIGYFERGAGRIPDLSAEARARFADEEVVHSEMFARLLTKLRPDLYDGATAGRRFLVWGRPDDLALRLAPPATFFFLAWLFEEITLFMPAAMAEAPEEACALVRDVMDLHAREEQPHVAIDAHVLARVNDRSWRVSSWLQAALALPLLLYVDRRVRAAWRRLCAHATVELDLTPAQRAKVEARGPTRSDVLGMESFAEKVGASRLTGAKLLSWALARALRRARA
ncbi:MAG: diiron oxygenase [Polyangiaceae bacterium]|nr:diiron oxygenase [Polyangiaceae bacterium]